MEKGEFPHLLSIGLCIYFAVLTTTRPSEVNLDLGHSLWAGFNCSLDRDWLLINQYFEGSAQKQYCSGFLIFFRIIINIGDFSLKLFFFNLNKI